MMDIAIKKLWRYEIKGEVNRVGASKNCSYIVAVSPDDKKAYLFNGSGKLNWYYKNKAGVNSVAISPDGRYIIIGSKGSLLQMDQNKNIIWEETIGSNSIVFSSDARYFACGGNDGTIYFFTRHANLVWRLAVGDYINCLSISENNSVIASSDNRNVYYINNKGKMQGQNKLRSRIKRVDVSSNGDFFVTAGGDEFISLYDKGCQLVWRCNTGEMINAVSITPDGNCIVGGSEGGNIFIIDKKGQIKGISHESATILDIFINQTGGLVVGSKGNVSFYKVDVSSMEEPVSNLELLIKELPKMNEELAGMYQQGVAVMFIDIKDYSPWTQEETQERKLKLLKYEEILNIIIEEYEGIKIKNIQESIFVIFNEPVKSISCGLKIKEIFEGYNQERTDEEKIPIRVGINFVKIEGHPGKTMPIEINITAEITALSTDTKILATKAVLGQIEGVMLEVNSIGLQKIKGCEKSIPVYNVEESPYAKTGWYGG